MLKLILNSKENRQKINFTKKVDQRLTESIKNIEYQNQLYSYLDKKNKNKSNFNIEINNNYDNKQRSHKQLGVNNIYKTSFVDLKDKRNIFKYMYGEFWNINNFETLSDDRKKGDIDDDKSLIRNFLFKLRMKNKQRLFQSKSNKYLYLFDDKYFHKQGFNRNKFKNSFLTTFDKKVKLPNNSNEQKFLFTEKDNEIIELPHKYNTIESSKNIINNYSHNKNNFNNFSTMNKIKFKTIDQNDRKNINITEYNHKIKNRIIYMNNKKFKNNNYLKRYMSQKKLKEKMINFLLNKNNSKQKEKEIQSQTNLILDNNKNIEKKIYLVKKRTKSYLNSEEKSINLITEKNNYENTTGYNDKNDIYSDRAEKIERYIFSKTNNVNITKKFEELNKKINKMNNPKHQIQQYFSEKTNTNYSFHIINDYISNNKNKKVNDLLIELLKPRKKNKKVYKMNGRLYMSENHYRLSEILNDIKNRQKLSKEKNILSYSDE